MLLRLALRGVAQQKGHGCSLHAGHLHAGCNQQLAYQKALKPAQKAGKTERNGMVVTAEPNETSRHVQQRLGRDT